MAGCFDGNRTVANRRMSRDCFAALRIEDDTGNKAPEADKMPSERAGKKRQHAGADERAGTPSRRGFTVGDQWRGSLGAGPMQERIKGIALGYSRHRAITGKRNGALQVPRCLNAGQSIWVLRKFRRHEPVRRISPRIIS